MLPVDDEDRQVVVAGEVRARRLHDVEVREAAGRRPRRLLADAEAAVHLLRPRGDRVPEVRPGLRVGGRQRPDLAAVQRADVLVDQRVCRAQHDRVDRADVHHVAHRRRRASVAGDRLAHHRVRDVVLAEAAVLLGNGERESRARRGSRLRRGKRSSSSERFALSRISFAQRSIGRTQLLLAVGETRSDPPRSRAPERLVTLFLGHRRPSGSVHGGSQPSSTGRCQSVPTVLSPAPRVEPGCGNFVCFSFLECRTSCGLKVRDQHLLELVLAPPESRRSSERVRKGRTRRGLLEELDILEPVDVITRRRGDEIDVLDERMSSWYGSGAPQEPRRRSSASSSMRPRELGGCSAVVDR